MVDIFKNVQGRDNPGDWHFAITPSDDTDFEQPPRAVYCASDGTAQIVDIAGTVLPYAMTAGDILPFRARRINATDTTGTFYGIY